VELGVLRSAHVLPHPCLLQLPRIYVRFLQFGAAMGSARPLPPLGEEKNGLMIEVEVGQGGVV